MARLIINVDNPKIIPSLKKVLGEMKGVSIEKAETKEPSDEDEDKKILRSIEKGYKEARQAKKKGQKLPDLDELIEGLEKK